MKGWVGVNLAVEGSFLEEIKTLLTYTKIHLFEFGVKYLNFGDTYLNFVATYLNFNATYLNFGANYLNFVIESVCSKNTSSRKNKRFSYQITCEIVVTNASRCSVP